MLGHCCRESYMEFLVWECWGIRFVVSIHLESGRHSFPTLIDSGFLHSAIIMYQPLGWGECYSGGTWKAKGGMGVQGWQAGSNQLCPGLWRTAFTEEGTSELTHKGRFTELKAETDIPGVRKSTWQARWQKKVVRPRWFGMVDVTREVGRARQPLCRTEKWQRLFLTKMTWEIRSGEELFELDL